MSHTNTHTHIIHILLSIGHRRVTKLRKNKQKNSNCLARLSAVKYFSSEDCHLSCERFCAIMNIDTRIA